MERLLSSETRSDMALFSLAFEDFTVLDELELLDWLVTALVSTGSGSGGIRPATLYAISCLLPLDLTHVKY